MSPLGHRTVLEQIVEVSFVQIFTTTLHFCLGKAVFTEIKDCFITINEKGTNIMTESIQMVNKVMMKKVMLLTLR